MDLLNKLKFKRKCIRAKGCSSLALKQTLVNDDRPVEHFSVYVYTDGHTETFVNTAQHVTGATVFTSTNCRNEPYLCA